MLYGFKKVKKSNNKDVCQNCGKPLGDESFYGGYGWTCNKACAKRKDEERAQEAKKLELMAKALAQPAPSAAGKQATGGMGNILLWVGIATLVIIVVIIIIVKIRKKG